MLFDGARIQKRPFVKSVKSASAGLKWIGTIVREVFGLFVDDGNFAIAILVWLALVGLGLPRLGIAAVWDGLILFAGLALIMVVSAAQRARR